MRVECTPDVDLGRTVLAVAIGHLDAQGANDLWDAISPHLSGQRVSLLIDMAQVDWISSAGVGTMVRLLTRCQALGGNLAVFECAARVRSVLRICGLDVVLNVRDSGEDARLRLRELGVA